MKKMIISITLFVVYTCTIWIGSRWHYQKEIKKLPIKIVEKTEVKQIKFITKYVDYSKMTRDKLVRDLKYINEIPPRLDGYVSGNWFIATASLGNDRSWTREFKLEVGRDSRFRYYVYGGLATAAIISGAYFYRKWKD